MMLRRATIFPGKGGLVLRFCYPTRILMVRAELGSNRKHR
jgi:hypothetical protein